MIWLGFTAFIVYGAIVPFRWIPDGAALGQRLHLFLSRPFALSNAGDGLSLSDVLQNILLFIPFGALGVLAGAPGRPARARVAFVAAVGIGLSASVECVQLLTIDRVPSLGDVVWDTLGCLLGAGLAVRFLPHIHRGLASLQSSGWTSDRELRPVVIAVVLLAITSWHPFDITLEIGSLARKLRFLAGNPWQFWGWHRAGTSFMLSTFLAMALAGYLSIRGAGLAGRKAAALGTAVVFLLEAGQMFVDSRVPGLADPLLASAGVAAGAAIWVMAGRIVWPGLWLGVLVAMTLVSATVQVLARVGVLTTFEAVGRTIELALLFFPLGYWIGHTGPNRWRAYGTGVVLALALAVATAAVQFWARGRCPDATLAGTCLAGVALGIRSGSPQT